MNEFEKAQSAKILSCYGIDIEKGRKAVPIGSKSPDGEYIKTNDGWKPTEKEGSASDNEYENEKIKQLVESSLKVYNDSDDSKKESLVEKVKSIIENQSGNSDLIESAKIFLKKIKGGSKEKEDGSDKNESDKLINKTFFDSDGEQIITRVSGDKIFYIDKGKLDDYKKAKESGNFFTEKILKKEDYDSVLSKSPVFQKEKEEGDKRNKEKDEKTKEELYNKNKEKEKNSNDFFGFVEGGVSGKAKVHDLTKVNSIKYDGNNFKNKKDFVEWAIKQKDSGTKAIYKFEPTKEGLSGRDSYWNENFYNKYVEKHGEPENVKKKYQISIGDSYMDLGKNAYDYYNFLKNK